MGLIDFIKGNWRIILLVIFVSAALVALFIPGGIFADDTVDEDDANTSAEQGLTNLVFGLGLDGGARISAPAIGMTAESVEIDPDREVEVQRDIQESLEIESADLLLRTTDEPGEYTVEVFNETVSESDFLEALDAAGIEATEDDIRPGVTQQTRDEIIDTVDTKLDEAGLAGQRVNERTMADENLIVAEVPDRTLEELRTLLSERGIVEVVAHYPGEDGEQVNETVLERLDFDTIGSAEYNAQNGHHVPVTIQPDVAPEFQAQMNEMGFTSDGVGLCEGMETDFGEDTGSYCLLTKVDGEVVDAHAMGDDLAAGMRSGEWQHDPQFVMLAPSQVDAQSLSVNLRAGSLRAPLDFDRGQSMMVLPALADQFKLYSLLIGIISVVTVSGVIYLRYADARVAVPMVATAMSEVVILLGFAAAIGMPLDLAHVAGFIAVIGTGVDDLIIIADEVMSRGDVNSRRVFHSRFKKAFWVIGAAAATTIIAMSPLALMDIGDLQGFAIITILGVLIGVLITRPAYGDILRALMTEK